jgi:hypothetical protein
MLDDLAIGVKAEDVNSSGLLAGPVQIAHMYERQIPIDGNTFHLTGNAAGLLDVGHDAVESIREERIVLNVSPGYQTRKQIGSALIKNLIVYNVQRVSDMLYCHKSSFGISLHGIPECSSNRQSAKAVMLQIALGGGPDGSAKACPIPSATFCRTLGEAPIGLQSWRSNQLRGS